MLYQCYGIVFSSKNVKSFEKKEKQNKAKPKQQFHIKQNNINKYMKIEAS